MYYVTNILEHEGAPSLIDEISFHPSGDFFAATYETTNVVRVYDSRTQKLLYELMNPEAQLDAPHGVVFTTNHLIISNKINLEKPSTINVYRNDRPTDGPIQVFDTPFDYLRSAHSLAFRDGKLLATYTENISTKGAIVSYGFNEETGEIIGLLDKTESWFADYGKPKGICFSKDGTNVLVTFELNKKLSTYGKIRWSLEVDRGLKFSKKVTNLSIRTLESLRKRFLPKDTTNRQSIEKNGAAIFSVNDKGMIGRKPVHVTLREDFCRLENIDIFDGNCIVTDAVNHRAFLYDLTGDLDLENPVQTINFRNALPHGAKFSPDGELLIISGLGLRIVDQVIIWGQWGSPREDKIFICERANKAPTAPPRI